jgi:hypothetical protein
MIQIIVIVIIIKLKKPNYYKLLLLLNGIKFFNIIKVYNTLQKLANVKKDYYKLQKFKFNVYIIVYKNKVVKASRWALKKPEK